MKNLKLLWKYICVFGLIMGFFGIVRWISGSGFDLPIEIWIFAVGGAVVVVLADKPKNKN